MSFLFEKLNVYTRSLEFAIGLCKRASDFPITYSRIRDQLIGAAVSVPLNIAEGSGRKTVRDRNNFYKISRTSLFECVPLFEICLSLNLIDQMVYNKAKAECEELSKMLSGLIRSNLDN